MNYKVIAREEWWPVFTLDDPEYITDDGFVLKNYGEKRHIPDELLTSYTALITEFDSIQDQLRALYNDLKETE